MEILLVEDDPSHATLIRHTLERHGHVVTTADTAVEGKATLRRRSFDLLVVDYVLPGATGMTLLDAQQGADRRTPTVFLTGTDSADVCLAAVRRGAVDYIVKGPDYLRTLPERIAAAAGVPSPPSPPQQPPRPAGRAALDRLLGASPQMVALKHAVLRAARSDLRILIEGPTGSGKELVARAIHALGPRAGKPFVVVNCAALPAALFESELFGHVRGAFTNAVSERRGLAVAAHEGTLFLDEVGELAPEGQAKLLRLVETLEVRPVGGDRIQHVDVRVLAATNRSLRDAVRQRRFREDLFYRLTVVYLVVPPLTKRQGDVRLLARAMVQTYAPRLGLAPPAISEEAYAQLEEHDWPGNVRELENAVKRTLADLEGRAITAFKLSGAEGGASGVDRRALEALLVEHAGNLTQVAGRLGMSRPTLYRRLKELGIAPLGYRPPGR